MTTDPIQHLRELRDEWQRHEAAGDDDMARKAWGYYCDAMHATLPALLAVADSVQTYRDACKKICEQEDGFDGVDLLRAARIREAEEALEAARSNMLAKLDEVKP